MIRKFINLAAKRATLRENRLFIYLSLILSIVLIITLYKCSGGLTATQLASLSSVNESMLFAMLLLFSLMVALKSFEFKKAGNSKEFFNSRVNVANESASLVEDLNIYQEAAADITGITSEEEDMRLSLHLDDLLSSMSEGLFLVDKSGHSSVLNKKAHELITSACNYKDKCLKRGMGLSECPHGILDICEMGLVVRELRENPPDFENVHYVREIHTENNRDFSLTVTNLRKGREKGGFLISATDITDNKAMQKQLFISSKLAALGEMAAGIAHEVNNPLQIMVGNLDLLEHSLKEEGLGVKKVEDVKDGIFKIKSIVSNMLIFAREESMATEDVDVNSVIASAIEIVSGPLATADISIERDFQSSPMPVNCNNGLLQQVILNIIRNAMDAMEEFDKGSVIHVHANQYCDEKVVIVITDDGPGISERVINRVFDPFFTTKDVGRGTGLGLSVSRRIIESMGGDIKVSSIEGVSTSFYITLTSGSDNSSSPGDAQCCDDDLSLLFNKKVLMLVDEDMLVDIVKPIITPMVAAFDTFTSVDGAGALLSKSDYDIILLDINKSEAISMELYDLIKDQAPHLKDNIIFLSGEVESEKMRGFLSLTGIPTIKKPFGIKEILSVVTLRIEEKGVRK